MKSVSTDTTLGWLVSFPIQGSDEGRREDKQKSKAERKEERSSIPRTYPIKRKSPDLPGKRNWVTSRAERESLALARISACFGALKPDALPGKERRIQGIWMAAGVVLPDSPVELVSLIRAFNFKSHGDDQTWTPGSLMRLDGDPILPEGGVTT